MAKEIAADSTISVSLIRQIDVTERSITLPPSPPLTPSSEESDAPSPLFPTSRPKILRRVARSQPRLSRPRRPSEATINSVTRQKPLPQIPAPQPFSETRALKNDLCIGFPKRPRQQFDTKSHPSLETIASLPDGLHKTQIHLNRDMLPSIDWGAVNVKVGSQFGKCATYSDFLYSTTWTWPSAWASTISALVFLYGYSRYFFLSSCLIPHLPSV